MHVDPLTATLRVSIFLRICVTKSVLIRKYSSIVSDLLVFQTIHHDPLESKKFQVSFMQNDTAERETYFNLET